MIDFAALVLAPAMATFGQPISVTPVVSQPGAAAFGTTPSGTPLVGIYASKPVTIPLEGGGYHSTVQPTLGIRLADFAVPPMQGDLVAFALGTFVFADVIPDGQGGADCPLRDTASADGTTNQDGG